MKYIRTKDGRIVDIKQGWMICDLYDESDSLKQCYQRHVYKQNGDVMNIISESFTSFDILNQSDSLEELCDEFVLVNPNRDIQYQSATLQEAFDDAEDKEIPIGIKEYDEKRDLILDEYAWSIFGAIWTEWGLKYVAKMNNKGELELL